MCYNNARRQEHRRANAPRMSRKKDLKNFQKTFRKPLDKRKTMCYNNARRQEKRRTRVQRGTKNLEKFSKNFSKTP